MKRIIRHVRSWFDFGESWKVDPTPGWIPFVFVIAIFPPMLMLLIIVLWLFLR